MNTTNVIRGVINATKYTVTAPVVKEDYGLFLKIEGTDLPETYEVDFSNEKTAGTSVTMIGTAEDGVHIPNQFIKSGRDVFAFLYLVSEDYGRTVYKFRIPNKLRPDRTDIDPDPEEQSLIDQAIAALNVAKSGYDKCIAQNQRSIFIADSAYTDATTFKTAVTGQQLVYKLATPQTYQLTPTEVRTLLGQNNVWADTGNSTVEYYADTKRYIDKRIAEIVN